MWGGEIFIPKIPSYNILDLAKAVNPKLNLSSQVFDQEKNSRRNVN